MAQLEDVSIGATSEEDPKKQIESVVKQTNEALRLISNEDRTKIIKDDAGTQRLLMGFQQDGFSNGDVGVKLSQEGTDVLGASGDGLIFSTDFNVFKIVSTGTLDIVMPSVEQVGAGANFSDSSYEITHNLGYVPIFVAYLEIIGGNFTPIPYRKFEYTTSVGSYTQIVHAESTDTNLSFFANAYVQRLSAGTTTIGGFNGSIKYYILQESAA